LNRGEFPDRGWSQNVSTEVAVPGSDYLFYKVSWTGQRYFPVSRRWTLRTRGDVDFGGGYSSNLLLLFFENSYSGGIASVRSYRARSLGPRAFSDQCVQNLLTCFSAPEPICCYSLTEASIVLLFPTPFAPDRRTLGTFLSAVAAN